MRKKLLICLSALLLLFVVSCDPGHGDNSGIVKDLKFKNAMAFDDHCKRSITSDTSSAALDAEQNSALNYKWYFKAHAAGDNNNGKEYSDRFYEIDMIHGGTPKDKLTFYVLDKWSFEVYGFEKEETVITPTNALFYSISSGIVMSTVTTVEVVTDYTEAGKSKFFDNAVLGHIGFTTFEYLPPAEFHIADDTSAKITISVGEQSFAVNNIVFRNEVLKIENEEFDNIDLPSSEDAKEVRVTIEYSTDNGTTWQKPVDEYVLHSRVYILSGMTTWMKVKIIQTE